MVPLWGGQAVILNSLYLQYHETINEALEAVPYDGVIIVHRGVYDEHLSINKPVAIIGASMWSSFLSITILFWSHFSSDSLIKVYLVFSLKNCWKFVTSPLVSLWNDSWWTSPKISYWWCVTAQIRVVLLISCAAREICVIQSEALPRSG